MASLAQSRTQVLVVGAGSVGLMAALCLRLQGLDVRVVDQQAERGAHAFPVVLHPHSLQLLVDAGVAEALHWRGREVTRLAVYTEHERRAVLDLPHCPAGFKGVLTLPQDTLRQALLNALSERGVNVEWNTRLAALEQDERSIGGRLVRDDPARLTASGSAAEVDAFEADFVIGADGYDSMTRRALGIDLVDYGALQTFAFFDAATQRSGHEAQLALADSYANSVYPLQSGQSRFSFQLGRGLDQPPDANLLNDLVLERMPWYAEGPLSCDWSGVAEFRHALVAHFGVNRAWLAGEAAHLTGPLGVQSLNVGLDEAHELSLRIAEAVRHPRAPSFGPHYDAQRGRQWRALLGLEELVVLNARSPDWARRHALRLVSCLPASRDHLTDLLDQLRLVPISGWPPS